MTVNVNTLRNTVQKYTFAMNITDNPRDKEKWQTALERVLDAKPADLPSAETDGLPYTLGVCIAHCCLTHGCKYQGTKNFPCCVADGIFKQDHPCEECSDEMEQLAELTKDDCKHPGSRLAAEGADLAVICRSCDVVLTYLKDMA